VTSASTVVLRPAEAGRRTADVTGDPAATVTVRGLHAGYDGRHGYTAVLAGLDLTLAAGESLAVVGASGCGKSTLLHALAGVLTPKAGQVLVDGQVVASTNLEGNGRPGCRAGHAAYMFQRDLLLPWKTVLDNAAFAANVAGDRRRRGPEDHAHKRAHAILEEFGLGDALDALPRKLSGGMRQRVALARTLVLGRGLVLLDEPFGSLDTLTRADLQAWLLDVMAAHPATWVLVTHDVREAVLLGDRVAVLAGRPARLEGWVEVSLSREERRVLALQETGGTLEHPGALDAATATMSALTSRVRELLAQRHVGRQLDHR